MIDMIKYRLCYPLVVSILVLLMFCYTLTKAVTYFHGNGLIIDDVIVDDVTVDDVINKQLRLSARSTFVIGSVRSPFGFYVSYWRMLLHMKVPSPYT